MQKPVFLHLFPAPPDLILLNKNMKTEKQSKDKISSRGGARVGSGRPKGSTHKITARDLLEQCEAIIGKPFAVSLLEGYRDSIYNGDTKLRNIYEKIILDKTAATMLDVEVEEVGDGVESKVQAFQEAIKALTALNSTEDINNTKDTNHAISKK